MAIIRNLGAALTVLVRAQASEIFMHHDVDAFGAPSECHDLVSRGAADRQRLARRHAESVARAPMRVILRQAQQRGCQVNGPRWQSFLGRVYQRNYPF